nr:hypothetical protein [Tanacetum cinerariifolium]
MLDSYVSKPVIEARSSSGMDLRTEFLKKVFVTENITVDGMQRNQIPPPRVVPIEVLVINEPASEIFFMNMNTDVVFQREEEFHLATTVQLIRVQKSIQRGTSEVDEMFRKLKLTIEARDDAAQAREIVKR